MTSVESAKKQPAKVLALPEWVKDYSGILLVGLFIFSASWNYAQDKYYLQVICSIGVAVIVATALNLVVGYIGQVALGHAGFVALGGYVTGLLLGRIPGSNNWIDFLYLRKTAGYTINEQANPQKANAARETALNNVNNTLEILLPIFIVLTLALGTFFWFRWQKVKRNKGAFERHFWHNPSVMRLLFYAAAGGGAGLTLISYILNLSVKLPSIVTLLVLVLALVISYLCWNQARKMLDPNTPLRPGFWDSPEVLKAYFLTTVILGGIIIASLAVFLLVGLWVLQNFWVALLLGAVLTGVFGYLLALPALRVKGPYLSMVTIAFGLIVYEVVISSALQPTIGSQNGLNTIPYPMSDRNARTDIISQANSTVGSTNELFLTSLIIMVVALATLYIIRNFIRSRWGRSLIALRENEIGASSVGVNVTRMKTLAFVFSASLAGVAGVLNAYSFSFVGPSFSLLERSVAYVTMLILGGVGTLYGPAIGAIVITVLPEMLKNLETKKVDIDIFTGIDLMGLSIGLLSLVLLAVLVAGLFILRQNRVQSSLAIQQISRWLVGLIGLVFGIPVTIAIAGTIDVPSVDGTPNLFLELFQLLAYLVGFVLVGGMVYYSLRGWRGNTPAKSLATAIGFIVVFNSIEVYRGIFNSLGSITGIGFKKTNFDVSDWLIILLYFVMISLGIFVTTPQMKKMVIRGFAAGFIMFIPVIFRFIFGLGRNSDGTEFKPTEILLTIYGAILLYFLYLVPKGIGGLLGQVINQYLPTAHRVNYKILKVKGVPEPADSGGPPIANPPGLAFHKTLGNHEEFLRLARVTRDFKGLRAVDAVEMKLNRGDIHALIGPNGAGKTTVLNLISGLYPVSQGQIVFRGNRVDGLRPHIVAREGISRTFQNLQVFGDMTVIENVMVGFHLNARESFWSSLLGLPTVKREEERIKALSMQLLEFVGLENRAYSKAKDLPYGYQRLLEIARALGVEPEVLLLDEPAAGLNPHEIGDMDRLIRKIKNEGVTVLLIEHHMDLVMEISDEITVLDYGKKISEGAPAAIQNDQKVKDAYFGPEVVINARS